MLFAQENAHWSKFTKARMAHRTKTAKTAVGIMKAVSFSSFVSAI